MARQVDPFYENFGNRLRKARQRAGLAQEVAAGLAEMLQSDLSRIEAGRRSITLKDMQKLAAVYGVPYDQLVCDVSPLDVLDV